MPPATCPSPEQLSAFNIGKLPLEDLESLAQHLEGCSSCQATLQGLGDNPDTLVSDLRQPAAAGFPAEEACRRAVARVQALGSDPGVTSDDAAPAGSLSGQFGRYVLLAKAGEGGMGAVYRATHSLLKRDVALKVLPAGRVKDRNALARFHREIEAVGRLDHPNIVRASDAGEADGTHFLVMEWIEGTDLGRLVQRRGPLSAAEACELVRQAALGLQHAHEHGLTHRDVKPSNLMVTPGGQVKVLDLGLALLRRDEAERGDLTEVGQVMGTFDYLAPEQAGNAHTADARADVYGLGCTLYFLLAGRAPFAGRSGVEKLMAHRLEEPATLAGLRPDLPAGLAAVVAKMMAKDPADRPASMAEVSRALEPFAQGVPSPVPAAAAPAAREGDTAVQAPARSRWKPWLTLGARLGRFKLRLTIATAAVVLAGVALTAVELGLRGRGGTVVVQVPEDNVIVFVDGRERAAVGSEKWVRLALSPGKHELAVRRDGQELFAQDVTLKAGREELVAAQWDLTPAAFAVAGFSPLDRLDPAAIPPEERFASQPRELVAVLREHAEGQEGEFRALAFSPNGAFVAYSTENVVHLRDAATLRRRAEFTHPHAFFSLAFSPDGKRLATAGGGEARGEVFLWDVSTGQQLTALKVSADPVYSVAFARDGRTLATAGSDATVRLWALDAVQPREQAVLQHPARVELVTFSPDGRRLLSAGGDGKVRVWDAVNGREVSAVAASLPAVASFSPDGARLAWASGEELKVADASTGAELTTLLGHANTVVGVAFAPDGQTLASAARPNQVILWEPATGKRLHEWTLPGEARSLAFAPDGRHLVAANADGAAYVLRLAPPRQPR
jgi:Protein kinase domain/WD domain, G-beta repeat